MNREVSLENRTIPGVTFKFLAWLIGGLLAILGSVVFSYVKLSSQNEKNQEGLLIVTEQLQEIKSVQKEDRQKMEVEIVKLKSDQQALQIQLLTLQVQLQERNLIPVK